MEKHWEAAGCAASYLLFDPDEDTMIDNLRFYKYALGHDSIKITARKVLVVILLCFFFLSSVHYDYF